MAEYYEGLPIQVSQDPDPDAVLGTVQTVRLDIAQKLTQHGIPTDRKDIRMLTEVLRDLDATALGQKRAKTDDEMVNQAAACYHTAKAIIQSLGRSNPFERQGQPTALEMPEALPDIVQVPGHTRQGNDPIIYEDLMSQEGSQTK